MILEYYTTYVRDDGVTIRGFAVEPSRYFKKLFFIVLKAFQPNIIGTKEPSPWVTGDFVTFDKIICMSDNKNLWAYSKEIKHHFGEMRIFRSEK